MIKEKIITRIITTILAMATLFFRSRRMPSFQKLTLSRIIT